MLTALPAGATLKQMQAQQPTATHETFVRTTMNEASRCLNMPLNVALCDSSKSNYASGRMDYQVFFKAVGIDQDDCVLTLVARIFALWLAEALLVYDALQADVQVLQRPEHQWFWDGQEHVDPVKESASREIDLGCGMTSIPREYARMGLDYEKEQEKQAESLGLSLAEFRKLLVGKLYGAAKATAAERVKQADEQDAEDQRAA